ncbi:MAG TPA: excalibur calcium-binding domain-containing protein [Rhodoferax sp.]
MSGGARTRCQALHHNRRRRLDGDGVAGAVVQREVIAGHLNRLATHSAFNCDGRKRCSQMTSCTEAKLFLKNCPGMEMDGNHDGVPC